MIYAVSIIIFYAVSAASAGIILIFNAVIAQFEPITRIAASMMLEASIIDPFAPACRIAPGLETSEAASISISESEISVQAYHLIAQG